MTGIDSGPPLITIGVTCFCAEKTIARAIESALAQEYPHTEIVVVDDGSQDASRDILTRLAQENPTLRLVFHDRNLGAAAAYNSIVAAARGEFIAFFDDDDMSARDRLSRQKARIEASERQTGSRLILCHTARRQLYPDGAERTERTPGTDEALPPPSGPAMARRILIGDPGLFGDEAIGSTANCSRMARTSVFRSFGFDTRLRRCEDTDFAIRFALAGGYFAGIDDPLVTQTMSGGADKTLAAEEKAERQILKFHEDFLAQIGWRSFAGQWLELRYANYRRDLPRMMFLAARLACRHPVKFAKKIVWALPSRDSRRAFIRWKSGGVA